MKIGMALGGSIGLYLLNSTGFMPGFTPDVAWPAKFMRASFMIPGFVYIAAALIMLLFYKISDADAAKYAQENADKMAQK